MCNSVMNINTQTYKYIQYFPHSEKTSIKLDHFFIVLRLYRIFNINLNELKENHNLALNGC